MSHVPSNNSDNYTIGGTRIFFAEEISTGVYGDYHNLGNIVSATVQATIDRLEHYTSKTGTRIKDREIIRQVALRIPFVFDEPDVFNLNRLFLGDEDSIVDVAAYTTAVVDEVHTGSVDRYFYLNLMGASSIVVKDTTGVTTYDITDDYIVETVGKMTGIRVVAGGAITDGDSLKVSYTPAVPANKKVVPLSQSDRKGRAIVQFVSDTGNEMSWAIPKVSLGPDGDFGFNDQDWSTFPMALSVDDAGGAEGYGVISVFGTGENT